MDQICLVVPVLPGRTADALDFMRELETDRKADYQTSEQRIGIVKEAWYLARTPAGDQLVAYMESPDFPKALSMFSQSRDRARVYQPGWFALLSGEGANDEEAWRLREPGSRLLRATRPSTDGVSN